MKKDTELVEIHVQAHTPHEVPSKDLKGLVKKAGKRIDTDVDGDTDKNDKKKGELGEFIPGVGNKRLYSTTGTKTAKESFSNWRQELTEVMTDKEDDKKVTEKKIKNKIVINPKLGEAVEAMGGQLIDLVEVAELEQQEKEKQDDKALDAKQKKISMVKKQVLMKKMQAVRQGAGADIVAHYEPEGNIVSEEEKKCAHNIEGEVCPVHGKKQCPAVVEETEDSLRDRRMERGGVDGNTRYDRAPKAPNTKKFGSGKTMAQKEMEKKYGKGASAMDIVKAQIRAKHGKGAIMDTKKK